MIRLAKSFAGSPSGSALLWFAFGSVALIGMAALTVDLGVLYYNKTRLQSAADAAALGAAKKLPNSSDAQALGLSLVSSNVPSSFGTVAQSTDVQIGTYTASSGTFVATASNPNAVKISTHRTSANGNAVQLAFANIFGQSSGNVSASSISVHLFPKSLTQKHHNSVLVA